ncbi:MAG TPA: DNA primase small subunit PriS [Candidatus Thermoplasmatota archaeon]|nr:DNA primase small subunit PriS [Candidatus Thermoplasmatota archaeon]
MADPEAKQAEVSPPPSGPPKGGPPPPEQIQKTVDWLQARFGAWYRANPPEMPPRYGRREFGFMWLAKTFMQRHVAFPTRADLARFLVDRTPGHCYYSTAYYKRPDAPTMKEKEWLGADLIFDLDADHLEGADKLSFEEQLGAVKTEAVKLLEDFLLPDFGFEPEDIRIVFSGGRGFHFHVSNERVWRLGASERREIVDYLEAQGFATDSLAIEATRDKDKFGNRTKSLVIPKPTEPGWRGRSTRGLLAQLARYRAMPDRDAARELQEFEGIGPKKAAAIVAELHKEDASGLSPLEIAAATGVLGHGELMKLASITELRVRGINDEMGESDEPVTADVKRLIRLPGSLHGKTGLVVTPVPIGGFRDFEPLRDAVAFGEEPVEVVVSKPETLTLGTTRFEIKPGLQELPEKAAIFMMLRRKALLPLA